MGAQPSEPCYIGWALPRRGPLPTPLSNPGYAIIAITVCRAALLSIHCIERLLTIRRYKKHRDLTYW